MKKTDSNNNYKKKLKILETSKKIIIRDGWSSNIFKQIICDDLNSDDLSYYFPNGYKDLLEFVLKKINTDLETKVKKINIINFPLSKRIKKILLIRLELLNEDKIFYKKTFNHLMLPQNSKIMKKNLYKSIDNMWYLAGDTSTDFSFYTKRITLAVIYINSLFIFFNKDTKSAELNIERNLKNLSKIPKIKERFSFIKDNIPVFLKGFLN